MILPSLTLPDAGTHPNDRNAKTSISGNNDENTLEIEIDSTALNHLKENGNVFILTDIENPQYLYHKIRGYDVDARARKLMIIFKEFVDICKTDHNSQTDINNSRTEYTAKIFDVLSPTKLKDYDLTFYVAKSGYATVDDWLKTLSDFYKIPECSTGDNKTFYLYHIQTIA